MSARAILPLLLALGCSGGVFLGSFEFFRLTGGPGAAMEYVRP